MLKRMLHWIWSHLLHLGCLALVLILVPRLITGVYAADRMYQQPEAPSRRVAIIFGAGFLDNYSWLRTSPRTTESLRFVGLLMIVTGGFWAATQRHLGRIMAYGSVAETGFGLLALSLDSRLGIPILFLLLPARALGLGATVALFSVVRGLLLRPLPVSQEAELQVFWNTFDWRGSELDFVREGLNGTFFRSDDVHSLAQAIVRLMSDPGELQRMGVRSREIIDREVNIATVVEGYLQAFSRACA